MEYGSPAPATVNFTLQNPRTNVRLMKHTNASSQPPKKPKKKAVKTKGVKRPRNESSQSSSPRAKKQRMTGLGLDEPSFEDEQSDNDLFANATMSASQMAERLNVEEDSE